MKKNIIFAALFAALTLVSCTDTLGLDEVSYNVGLALDSLSVKKVAPPTTPTSADTTAKVDPPQDTTRTNYPPQDTTTTKTNTDPDSMFPAAFGKLVKFEITEVPAIKDTLTGVIHDDKGTMSEYKAALAVFENVAGIVVFEKSREFPTIDELKGSKFVEGDFAGYNSAYDPGHNGNWLPAIATDESFGIQYSGPDGTVYRSIQEKTLKKWNWENRNEKGNYSVFVDGYSYSFDEDGKMVISYKENDVVVATLILY